MEIRYYDEILMTWKVEKGLTRTEANSRLGDLRMMEDGDKVSQITIEVEDKD